MGNEVEQNPGFFERLGLAWKVLTDSGLAQKLRTVLLKPVPEKPLPAKVVPPEKMHASGLFVLSVLQQDGRLVDFLQQDVTAFSDEEVGAAARIVHGGCRKALQRLVSVDRVMKEEEGATITLTTFDPNRIRLTGNVTGQPPYKGALKHHGWIASDLRFPALAETVDYRVLAPAEVEL
jgi:hypothetical protein